MKTKHKKKRISNEGTKKLTNWIETALEVRNVVKDVFVLV